jgi:hypothetical protein
MYTLEQLEAHPDLMQMLAIVELRAFAYHLGQFDQDGGADKVPSYWAKLIMDVREQLTGRATRRKQEERIERGER